jgi:FlaA1/EpsC-like NDP-sugar epimerase
MARPREDDAWLAPLSIDMFVRVAMTTVFHPFITALVPLCLRARTYPWSSTAMVASIIWAIIISVCWTVALINRRIAYGARREVDLSEEVIVITGGAGGLGSLLAEVYGMRGASVAVLDVVDASDEQARGVSYYKCDVSDQEALSKAAAQIEKDVSKHQTLLDSECN